MKINSPIRKAFTPIIISIAMVIGLIIGRYYKTAEQQDTFYIYPRADKLTNVTNYITQEYVDPIDKKELIEKTIPKMLEDLDPHSQYIPAKDLKRANEPLEGNFSGIGVQFNMLNDTLIILKTIANGPSEKIGILAGDRIHIVDGDTVAGEKVPSDSIVGMLKGPKGTKVNVGIKRRSVDELLYFDIIRDNIPLYSMDIAYMIRPEMGYIKLNNFSRTTFTEFTNGILTLRNTGLKKLILDLRSNGGGYLEPAVQIADQFLDAGELIVYTEGNARPRQEYRATKQDLCKDLDVVIIIDEGSASASEILSGAIQDNDRGTIIGRRSFGKGLVQEQNMFQDGSGLRLTIARYYTPTGRCIQKPYENGNSNDYYSELSARYLHGEFTEIDSIKFDDSLKYTTPGGKTVYGGGGIMPDIFIPIDTTNVTDYLISVRNRGLVYRFALEYTDQYRNQMAAIKQLPGLVNFLIQEDAFEQFIQYAARQGVKRNNSQIKISENILKTQLHAYIARNIFDNEGFYPAIESIDNTLLKAIEILNTNDVLIDQ